MMTLTIRRYAPEDADALAGLFFRAVHEGAAGSYSAEQRAAWAPERPSGPVWENRLGTAHTVVAEEAAGLCGFMSLTPEGYIDLAFVLPEAKGGGVAAELYRAIESEARDRGLGLIWTDASHPARRFFLKQGWHVVAEQHPQCLGVSLTNYRMEKHLATPD